jgi:putative tricarboxylic transport membrane protein
MTMARDRIGGIAILAFCIAYGWLALDIPSTTAAAGLAFNARSMPYALSILGILGSLWLIAFPQPDGSRAPEYLDWPTFVAFLVLMSCYGFTLRPLGFLLSTSLFLAGGFALLGERRKFRIALISLGIAISFWAILNLGLGVFIDPWPNLPETKL